MWAPSAAWWCPCVLTHSCSSSSVWLQGSLLLQKQMGNGSYENCPKLNINVQQWKEIIAKLCTNFRKTRNKSLGNSRSFVGSPLTAIFACSRGPFLSFPCTWMALGGPGRGEGGGGRGEGEEEEEEEEEEWRCELSRASFARWKERLLHRLCHLYCLEDSGDKVDRNHSAAFKNQLYH